MRKWVQGTTEEIAAQVRLMSETEALRGCQVLGRGGALAGQGSRRVGGGAGWAALGREAQEAPGAVTLDSAVPRSWLPNLGQAAYSLRSVSWSGTWDCDRRWGCREQVHTEHLLCAGHCADFPGPHLTCPCRDYDVSCEYHSVFKMRKRGQKGSGTCPKPHGDGHRRIETRAVGFLSSALSTCNSQESNAGH